MWEFKLRLEVLNVEKTGRGASIEKRDKQVPRLRLWDDEEPTTEAGLWGLKTNKTKDGVTQPCQGPASASGEQRWEGGDTGAEGEDRGSCHHQHRFAKEVSGPGAWNPTAGREGHPEAGCGYCWALTDGRGHSTLMS